jgi:hypothetical protein
VNVIRYSLDELDELLPELEPDEMPTAYDGIAIASDLEVDEFLDRYTANDYPQALRSAVEGIDGTVTRQGGARHPSLRMYLWQTLAEAMVGAYPARQAVDEGYEHWQRHVAGERRSRNELRDLLRWQVPRVQARTDLDEVRARLDKLFGDEQTSTDEQHAEADEHDDGMVPLIDWTEAYDPADDIVERLVIPGRWSQFVAKAKGGKSSLLMFMMIELSAGRDPFDGTRQQPVTVLYCDGEMGRADIEELIRDCGHDPITLSNLHCSVAQMRLDTATGAARLLKRVENLKARQPEQPMIVVLDGLNGFLPPGASESDDTIWRSLFDHTVKPLKRRGVAVVSGDNMGKDPTRGSRGSSVKTDKADAVMQVSITDKGAKLRTTHGRGGAYLNELALDAEGFDRAKPIRYWRSGVSYPAGTTVFAKVLDVLNVPTAWGRRKVRTLLNEKVKEAEANGQDPSPFQVRNDLIEGAIKYRRRNPIRP